MSMNTNFNIGDRIHELRVQNGLSQERLALRANITTTYLGLLERNQKNPTVKVIEQLCSQLNISLSDFFSPSPAEKPVDAVSMQILAQISDRSEDEKLAILQTVKDMLRLCDLSRKNVQNNTQAETDTEKDNMP